MKDSFMFWLAVLAAVLILSFTTFMTDASSGVLDGKIPIASGDCFFNENGEMVKGGEIQKFCVIGFDPEDERYFYAAIFNDDGKIVEVVRMDVKNNKNKSVWRLGEKRI